jgi:hypothetical protein
MVVGFAWLFFVSPDPSGEEAITNREDSPQLYEFGGDAVFPAARP